MSSWKPGDWNCRSCQYVNFCKRDSCQRCGEPKLGVPLHERTDYTSAGGAAWDVKPGDWYCSCGVHNYACRSNCFKCGAVKNDSGVTHSWGFACPGQHGWKSGDWTCTRLGCNEHNYASRTECFRCNALGTTVLNMHQNQRKELTTESFDADFSFFLSFSPLLSRRRWALERSDLDHWKSQLITSLKRGEGQT
uniref:RanBP2-type domain-containing protein n=1 Tax=Ananas comosus var. bracteatus TaxID=296719 RepID=A0A6V7P0F3_ANACO|nr:unnamed protein product [Ananas comosus var. bracteatus]